MFSCVGDRRRLGRAEADWRRRYDLIAGRPVSADSIVQRVDADFLTTNDCGDGATRKQDPSEAPTNGTTGYETTVGSRTVRA